MVTIAGKLNRLYSLAALSSRTSCPSALDTLQSVSRQHAFFLFPYCLNDDDVMLIFSF